jgi:hypothetical protein
MHGSVSLRPGSWLLPVIVLVLLVIVNASQTGCKTTPVATSTALIQEQPKIQAKARTSTSNALVAILVCPGSPTVPSALPLKGAHRVILSWKASAPADAKHAAAAGYCIYRGVDGDGPPAELLNHFPFSGNKCADDLVGNGKKYAYMVRAISDRGITSIASKPARAAIPKEPRNNSDLSTDSTPVCREAAGAK